jgi:hypothetical protein
MMQKTWGTESQSVAARVPGHHRPSFSKHFVCQSLNGGGAIHRGIPSGKAAFQVRHRSAPTMRLT